MSTTTRAVKKSRDKTCYCGLPHENHPCCRGCTIYLGKRHLFQEYREGLCWDCYRARAQGIPPKGQRISTNSNNPPAPEPRGKPGPTPSGVGMGAPPLWCLACNSGAR